MEKLTDAQWERIREHFPEKRPAPGKRGRKPVSTRAVLEAVLWVLNSGAPWRMLPQRRPACTGRGCGSVHLRRRQPGREGKQRDMTSKIIVAIVAIAAAVLSLAAPVAVEAQTLTVARNLVSGMQINYSGFTVGTTYRFASCSSSYFAPASCAFDSEGRHAPIPGNVNEGGFLCVESNSITPTSTSGVFIHQQSSWSLIPPDITMFLGEHKRFVAYSDTNCTTEVAAVTYTEPTTLPTWRVRDISAGSATIYIEEDHSTHGVVDWNYTLTPGTGACMSVGKPIFSIGASVPTTRSPTPILSGLSSDTTYTYRVYRGSSECGPLSPGVLAMVTFTTLPPPPPDPPSGVDGEPTTDVNGGNVTISWANPGDPDIATYEYSLRQAGGPVGEWTTIPGSNADTTSVTIDLATGEARAVNNATPPMAAWTIHLRARDTNGNAGGIFSTTVNAAAVGPGTVVPALPLAGLVTLALVLFLGG